MTDRPQDASLGTLLSEALQHLSNLLRGEFALARAEIEEKAHSAAFGLGLIFAGMVVAQTALNVMAAALVASIAEKGIPAGWSALGVGVVLALIAFLIVMNGMAALKPVNLAPRRTMANVRRDVETLKEVVENDPPT